MQARSYTLKALELLNSAPSLSVRDVAEALGVDVARAKEILERLRYGGYVEKAGHGYAITEKGRALLADHAEQGSPTLTSFIQGKQGSTEAGGGKTGTDTPRQTPPQPVGEAPDALAKRVEELSNRLRELESRLRDIESRLASLEGFVRDAARRSGAEARGGEGLGMETPVMSIAEAQSRLGTLLEKYLVEGRLIRVGSLVVDSAFYGEFKKRFPIKAGDVGRLSPAERMLLEEMRREMMVILYAGREYRLVDTG
ncbi:hypothetical protein [Desulfurococcus mucosus]|uniref:Uncharacterized protein n=1 Tax=Desulfurococcus mucosus (strain ATCC 35584 / DSM 2162 / JCM 9187 / O7/1) TaxID=765177 RepID=E8R863_DESM0|nr:hypothetical protein [Desulfurococcus mucosus]ADV64689.1 hypothetical protein Desmu_0370 [Desulfurococcus mucosus DSM 2162]